MEPDADRQLSLPLIPALRHRYSRRARRLQLKVTPLGEVEVVVPRGVSALEVERFVGENAQWLAAALDHYEDKRRREPERHARVPQRIALPAIDEHWQVVYTGGARCRVAVRPGTGELQVSSSDESAARRALGIWLGRRARQHLSPWLARLGEEFDLRYRRVAVRCQKTRWGSCSSSGQISLNRNLLFLRPELVRYLLLHELCHTVHMNHSRRYWALLERLQPDARRLDRELGEAVRLVPTWAYPW